MNQKHHRRWTYRENSQTTAIQGILQKYWMKVNGKEEVPTAHLCYPGTESIMNMLKELQRLRRNYLASIVYLFGLHAGDIGLTGQITESLKIEFN